MRAVLLAGVLLLVAGSAALAHTRSTSYSIWQLEGREARVTFRISQLELTRLPFGIVTPPLLPSGLGRYLGSALRMEAGGVPCVVIEGPRALTAPPDRALLEWRVHCPEQGELAIHSTLLQEVAPGHLHFARLRAADGHVVEKVLSKGNPRWLLPSSRKAQAQGSSLGSYLWIGIQHIATGYDHLVFLLGLLLLARRAREVITIVTGFTLAHSITLGLAALLRVEPDPRAIQSLIGLSIALVAAENAWLLAGRAEIVPRAVVGVLAVLAAVAAAGFGVVPAATYAGLGLFSFCYFGLVARAARPARLRAAIAFCFGLIHGFGFAGVLTEMELPQGRLLPALLGFNGGVEIGQLAIVAAVWPVLSSLAAWREGQLHRRVLEAGTGVVCMLGVLWMVGRGFG